MAENSGIQWTHHTFNPWVGCTKVSPACDHCYAEAWAKRAGTPQLWSGERRKTKTWGAPVKWNKDAEEKGIRYRVFCASLADVFDNQVQAEWRAELWQLIRDTPRLDWLLLTKRPQNIAKMLPADWRGGWANVWLGTTVENQTEADRRIRPLLDVPAAVHFLSCEPLLGPLNLDGPGRYYLSGFETDNNGPIFHGLDWVITGGESGPGFREGDPQWFLSLRDQCVQAGTAFLFKQWSGATQKIVKGFGRELEGVVWDQYPKVTA